MKRTQMIALILALCLLLAGCGGGEPAESVPETTAPVQSAAQEEKTVTLGTVDGNTYTNSYAGFGFALDENWVVYPAEELQEMPEDVESMFEGTEYEDEEFNNIMDFVAENVTDLTTMNLNYTKLSLQERLAYAAMDDEAVVDGLLENSYDTLVAAYANAGIQVESIEKKTVTFLGEEHCAMYTVATVEEVPYYILQIQEYGLGAYGITLTLASYVEDNTESLLDLYYTVE